MKAYVLLAAVLTLPVLIGFGCAAEHRLEAGGIQKMPLPENPAEREKPQYDENRSPQKGDDSRSGRGPMRSYVPGQVIVKFQPELDETRIGAILTQYQLSKIKALPLPGVYQLKILNNDTVEQVIETLSKETDVVYVEPNLIMQTR